MKNKDKYHGSTVLSIDYGTKNTGFCLFTIGRDPFPLPYKQVSGLDDEGLIKLIKSIYQDEFFDLIVLGLPKHKDGNDSEMTKTVRKFHSTLLKNFSSLPCFFQDEALSSYEAEDRMKNSPKYNFKIDKSKVDSLAASIILEEWLEQEPLC